MLWIHGIKTTAHELKLQKLESKILKAWNLETLKHPYFLCDSSFELVRVTLFFTLALVLGLLELILLSSLLVQILSILKPSSLLSLAQVLIMLEPIFCTLEVQVLSMSEPLFLSFLKHFLFFFEKKTQKWYLQWKWNCILEISSINAWASYHWQDPQIYLYHLALGEKRRLDQWWIGWCKDPTTNCQICHALLCPLS